MVHYQARVYEETKDMSSSIATTAPAGVRRRKPLRQFEFGTMHRSQLHFADYNPRAIDRYALQKLIGIVKRHGLIEPIVVNMLPGREGIIVGGHQRITAADAIYGWTDNAGAGNQGGRAAGLPGGQSATQVANDYEVPVAIVRVDEKREKTFNVILNNPNIQGQFDPDMLATVLSDIGQDDVAHTGFERADLEFMFDQGVCDSIFGRQEVAERPVLDGMAAILAAGKEAEKAKKDSKGEPSGGCGNQGRQGPLAGDWNMSDEAASAPLAETSPADTASQLPLDPNSREALRARRTDYLAGQVSDAAESEYMVVLVFNSNEQVNRFLTALDLPLDDRYVSGGLLASRLGIEV